MINAGILIGKQARVLVAALAIGATVLSLSAGQAEARPRRDNGTRCAATLDNGHIVFKLPGEYFSAGGGVNYQCMNTGNWRQTSSGR